MMDSKYFLLLGLLASNICMSSTRGLFSGVPCHRPYNCIFEDDDDGFETSVLVGEEHDVGEEAACQQMCGDTASCVSYTWWTGDHADTPHLCQLFSGCHRNYQDEDLTTVYSGYIHNT